MEELSGRVAVVGNTDALERLSRSLGGHGLSTRLFPRIETVITEAQRTAFDAIVVDSGSIPEGGRRACQLLHGHPRTARVPLVVIENTSDRGQVVDLLAHGATDVCSWESHAEELWARVWGQVRLHRARMDLDVYNRDLRTRCETLREQNAVAEQELHMAVHDMRSPLMGVMASLEVLGLELGSELDRAASDALERCIDLSVQLSAQLRDAVAPPAHISHRGLPPVQGVPEGKPGSGVHAARPVGGRRPDSH